MGIVVAVSLLVAVPDVASAQDQPQGGCSAAGQFIASMAREDGAAFGEFSSELGALRVRDDFALGLHLALCAPEA